MNSTTFKEQIDNIYERFYSINESLGISEAREYRRGLDDGIKEGLGSFLGNAWHKGKQLGNDIGDMYNKGKDMAKKVWNSVTEFTNSVLTKIKNGFNTCVDYIASAPDKIYDFMSKVYNGIFTNLKDAYSYLSDKADELKIAMQKLWDKITASVAEFSIKTGEYWTKNANLAKEWFYTNKAMIAQQAQKAKESSVAWLKEAGSTVLNLLEQVGKGTLSFIKGVSIFVLFLAVAPIAALVFGIYKLGKKSQELLSLGLDKVGEQWKKEVNDFRTASTAPLRQPVNNVPPISESFRHIKTFEGFKK
jgi:hypothetical protein